MCPRPPGRNSSPPPRREANQTGGHDMQRTMLKSKIHRATVTECDLHYVGSITIDPDLLDAADIMEFEQVAVVDVDNGARFETYTIAGQRGSGVLEVNSGAARMCVLGEVAVVEVDNGARFETYTIAGQRGSGEMKVNGAAARLVHRGDTIIVISYGVFKWEERR